MLLTPERAQSFQNRSRISRAAALVKVTTRICAGFTLHSVIRCTTRLVMVVVFPEPGPASSIMGP